MSRPDLSHLNADDIRAELHACVAYEDTVYDRTY